MTIIVHPALLALILAAAVAWRVAPQLRRTPSPPEPGQPTKATPKRQRFQHIPTFTESRYVTSSGYVMVREPDHPLAGRNGYVREHRKVLHDKIGPGPHKCAWCDTEVEWTKGRLQPGTNALVVDHLDGDKQNNSIDNLLASCITCNGSRNAPLVDVPEPGDKLCACGELASKGPRCDDCHREYERVRKAYQRRGRAMTNAERQKAFRDRRRGERSANPLPDTGPDVSGEPGI